MSQYTAPTQDMLFLLNEIAGLPTIKQLPEYQEVSEDLVSAILEASASFCQDVLSPLNPVGDQQGVKVEGDKTITPEGFADAYQQYVDNGWPSLPLSVEAGGQGLPELVNTPAMEMVMSANLAFSLCPMLTQGAVKTLSAHGDEFTKKYLIPKMVSGEWTGSMDLTEPQAGSDLSTVKTKAVPEGDAYRIKGQKIFISWGDHDMAENMVHLVLARLPDAPAGTRGISLFAVPKYLVNEDGSLGELNDIKTVSVEEKLGQHGSPTCVLAYGDNGGALGYLVGAPHRGLACMFTMMNHARINVGMQGLGLAERAYQQGSAYAEERVQGGQAIINYPDVKRMVMLMGSGCSAMRAMIYQAMGLADMAEADDADTAAQADKRLQLLTPIVKSWCTDITQEITSLNIQVHGGMGFVEETGAAQHYRDARILPIYEGTNAIQANDFAQRKFFADEGKELFSLLSDIEAGLQAECDNADIQKAANRIKQAVTTARQCAEDMLQHNAKGGDFRESACYFLNIFAYNVAAGLLFQKAVAAYQQQKKYGAEFYEEQKENLSFFTQHYLTRTDSLVAAVKAIIEA
ncbi:acyl-CoA dehydrogenase [Maricurvus nonylphenolicus]|uniref:acyl-CoA dehydrogenase family protein n=1 Tax=Maricurvus nonylphenolicus TaxID=1008307 RepID=UPI0036F1E279